MAIFLQNLENLHKSWYCESKVGQLLFAGSVSFVKVYSHLEVFDVPCILDVIYQHVLEFLLLDVAPCWFLVQCLVVGDHSVFLEEHENMRQVHQIKVEPLHTLAELSRYCLDLSLGEEYHVSVLMVELLQVQSIDAVIDCWCLPCVDLARSI